MSKPHKDTVEAKILQLLRQAGRPMTIAEIKQHFSPKQCHTVAQVTSRMAKENIITRIARGSYRIKLKRPAAMQDKFWDSFDEKMDNLRKAGH